MTSISSLLGSMPSLADYLSGSSSSSSSSTDTTATSLADYLYNNGSNSDSDTVSFSSTAQALLEQLASSSSTASTDTSTSLAQDSANFVTAFLADAGIDISNLSEDVTDFIDGLAAIVENMDGATQNVTLDTMTSAISNDKRASLTISADRQSISLTVQYGDDGTPTSLTVVEAVGTEADTALLTIGKDADDAASTLNISRMHKEYTSFGDLLSSEEGTASALNLYGADA